MISKGETRSARASLPFRTVSYSSGRQGPRRGKLGSAGALSSRGILPRNQAGMRPVFGKAPDGAAEKVRAEEGEKGVLCADLALNPRLIEAPRISSGPDSGLF